MAHVNSPFSLTQIADAVKAAHPDRPVPLGWGLSATLDADGNSEVYDPTGIFSDDEIHHAAENVVFDPDYDFDPDYIWLRDNAIPTLDLIGQSIDPNVSQLAKIVRRMLRQRIRVDAPPTG